ncbi:hypothetical protein H9651_05060 [Microbacterium sp. Sa4CUA7]|uniref:Uncharacterized protein n=1 Tax=Microbacterium pullorum TaxID=2762236 RepID=A0ABR8S0I2_9MICO|nr:hypothetical protein [Microbacterium pullorum]MBD7956996.1 hypothetical protein [Microbacterium pullorum]
MAALPFAQAGMLRRRFSDGILATITTDAPGAEAQLRLLYGLDMQIGEWTVTVCTALSSVRIRIRIRIR